MTGCDSHTLVLPLQAGCDSHSLVLPLQAATQFGTALGSVLSPVEGGCGLQHSMFACHGAQVSDMKLKGPSFETLSTLAEAVGPQFVASMLHKKAAAHKNPKVCPL